jgi:hypothetical protein
MSRRGDGGKTGWIVPDEEQTLGVYPDPLNAPRSS